MIVLGEFLILLFSEKYCIVGKTDRQTDRQADRQRGTMTDRQTDRRTDKDFTINHSGAKMNNV